MHDARNITMYGFLFHVDGPHVRDQLRGKHVRRSAFPVPGCLSARRGAASYQNTCTRISQDCSSASGTRLGPWLAYRYVHLHLKRRTACAVVLVPALGLVPASQLANFSFSCLFSFLILLLPPLTDV